MTYFSYFKMEDLFEVHRLRGDEQVEGPRAAKVGHDDRVNGHRSEKRSPRRRVNVGHGLLNAAQRLLDIETLTGGNRRVQARLFKSKPFPRQVPYQTENACKLNFKTIYVAKCGFMKLKPAKVP